MTPSLLARLDTQVGRVILRWIIGIVLVFGLLGCVVKGANNPKDPYLASPGSRPGIGGTFGSTKVSVRSGESFLEWCLLLAMTEQQRARGLMEVKDPTLGGYDGMLFRYDTDVTEQFFMRNTPMPLSVAYIGSDGLPATLLDMQPCEDRDGCPTYPPTAPYRFAIEVPQGKLPSMGIVQGAIVTDEMTSCS